MTRSLRRAAAMSIGAGLLAVLGTGGTAYAGSTGTVTLTVPGCVGKLHLDGGGSSNLATATLQSTGPNTCWMSFWQRNATGNPPVAQSFSVAPYSSGSAGSPYYHDSTHQVAISISNGSMQVGSAWYN